MYLLNKEKLKVGDLIFTRDESPTSRAIRKSLGCDYSHVLIYVTDSSCIHADGDGVHSVNIQRMLFKNSNDVQVMRCIETKEWTEVRLKELCKLARSQIGTEYTKTKALKAGIAYKTGFSKKSKNEPLQFCSKLVAESYEYAGIKISKDYTLCTPAELLLSKSFSVIESVSEVATEEEIEFANDSMKNSVSKQTNITNELLRNVRAISNNKIQTIEDVLDLALHNVELDKAVAKIINESGYLKMWADDIVKNQSRYFKINYPDSVIKIMNEEGPQREINMANEDIERFNEYRYGLLQRKAKQPFDSETLLQHINLYQILISLAYQRKEVFEYILKRRMQIVC
ncbi:hypothetical protein M2366_000533 [Aeromonas sp. BIGb0405]|uniref:YiiX/YebB-like N1pC/P60 family cysteine hydrolase n=1 Tax=Aeromonas sp. BIGb0405 TaxID=2940592 RepID=UPI0021683C13|nr:YiiX/YebB-like N1pC/P60 family cysteine hydrolase [Aeromonas sp. BIGb0405]MCS3454494.1 hypothetical protein [Aeromonas sp. BIGb0405]